MHTVQPIRLQIFFDLTRNGTMAIMYNMLFLYQVLTRKSVFAERRKDVSKITKVHLEPIQTSTMDLFVEIAFSR